MDMINIVFVEIGSQLKGQSRLAHSSRPGERQEAHLRSTQQTGEFRHLSLTADETSRGQREPRRRLRQHSCLMFPGRWASRRKKGSTVLRT